ncbi:MAG: acyl--CoA ligase [Deltaproteobacteria bacterium]|nr:acyl--CoA ligase [Deltaproteobacteria bacterium]
MTIADLVVRNARQCPDQIAFVEVRPLSKERKETNWRLFDERTNRLANALLERGAVKGQKVALLGRNSIHWLEAFFAILKTGACAVPLNFRFTDQDIQYCADIAEPILFIADQEYIERIHTLRPMLKTVKEVVGMGHGFPAGVQDMETLIGQASQVLPYIEVGDEEDCALYFTSGTTGAPKAVLHAHRSLMVAAISECTGHQWIMQDIHLMIAPLYHLAIGHLLGGVLVGARNVLLTEQIHPKIVMETVSKEQMTMVFLLVPWALDILEALDKKEIHLKDYDVSNWKLMHMGAQPIPPSLVKRWKAYFPAMQYDTTYGLSEGGGPGVTHLGMENQHKVGAIGKPGLLWDVRIVDQNGRDVKSGEVGEIVVKGSGVMKEYYKNPDATAQTIKNGWLYAGDLAKTDEDGFIYIVDRKKDLIISGGENIYPVEIENVIRRHPKVRDVGVIGVPEPRLGETVCAVIERVPGEELILSQMVAFYEENLPRYKRPRHTVFGHVPRSATGKIEKPRLREAYAKGDLTPCPS